MFTVNVPYKDYNDKPRTEKFTFLLEVRDVYKNLTELNFLIGWRDRLKDEEDRALATEELVDFFNNFEKILLAAYGEISENGKEFDRSNVYSFERSKAFAALMEMFLTDLALLNQMLGEIMPKDMEDIIKKQTASLDNIDTGGSQDVEDEVARLRAELERVQAESQPQTPATEQE